jgi:hypothetical protein
VHRFLQVRRMCGDVEHSEISFLQIRHLQFRR